MWNPTLYVSILRQTGSLDIVPASDQRLRELKDCITRDEKIKESLKASTRNAQVAERLHLAEMIGRFIERDAWKAAPKKRRKPNEIRLSPIDRFVDVLFPETAEYKDKHISQEKREKRLAAKKKFEQWIRSGEPWARMVQCYSYFILLLIPKKLSTEE
jgi:hypothetical protein